METRITKLLGIRHPILMGGMQWINRAEFVAAVSEAGGAGFLPAASFETKDDLVLEIRKTKQLTPLPFGVNISLLPEVSHHEKTNDYIEAVIEEGIPFVETSGRSPADIVPKLKSAYVKILHKVTTPRHAIRAWKEGVDAIILVGYEGGGHPGMDQIGTFVNLPATVECVDLPVIAAGGICDGKSYAAAMALGAEGVLMGTRWIATTQCPVHENLKHWIVQSGFDGTVIIQRSIRNAMRAVDNRKAREVLALEEVGTGLQELLPHISGKKARQALVDGDLDAAVLAMGQCSGKIHEILPVRDVMEKMNREYEAVRKRL